MGTEVETCIHSFRPVAKQQFTVRVLPKLFVYTVFERKCLFLPSFLTCCNSNFRGSINGEWYTICLQEVKGEYRKNN